MCVPPLAWRDCNYNYGTNVHEPIRCASGQVDLLAATGCVPQGGTTISPSTTVSCPSTANTTVAHTITISTDPQFTGPGCANATKTFYVRNTGESAGE